MFESNLGIMASVVTRPSQIGDYMQTNEALKWRKVDEYERRTAGRFCSLSVVYSNTLGWQTIARQRVDGFVGSPTIKGSYSSDHTSAIKAQRWIEALASDMGLL